QVFPFSPERTVVCADDTVVELGFALSEEEGVPEEWRRIVRRGTCSSKVFDHQGRTELQAITTSGLLRFERDLDLAPTEDLRLSWDWKVDKMPGTPEYKAWNDDGRAGPYATNSPIQVLVVFREGLSVKVIFYLWEPTVEVGYHWHEFEMQRVV